MSEIQERMWADLAIIVFVICFFIALLLLAGCACNCESGKCDVRRPITYDAAPDSTNRFEAAHDSIIHRLETEESWRSTLWY